MISVKKVDSATSRKFAFGMCAMRKRTLRITHMIDVSGANALFEGHGDDSPCSTNSISTPKSTPILSTSLEPFFGKMFFAAFPIFE